MFVYYSLCIANVQAACKDILLGCQKKHIEWFVCRLFITMMSSMIHVEVGQFDMANKTFDTS